MTNEEFELALDGTTDIFSAVGLQDIRNCLNMIAATRVGSVPLYRHFGTDWEWVDRPELYAMARYRADLMEAINRYEPRVEVLAITFKNGKSAAMGGTLYPAVRFRLREGIEI